MSWHDSTVINRLKIGHISLTHSYLKARESPPECATCQMRTTVHHFSLDCSQLAEQGWNISILPF